jgi:hypothetical protein
LYQATRDQAIHGEALAMAMENMKLDAPSDGLKEMVTTFGNFLNLPSRALLGTDEMAKHLTIRGEIAARSVQRAIGEGVDLTDKAAMQTYLESEMKKAFNLHSPDLSKKYEIQNMYSNKNAILAEADRATFQEDNGWASKVSKVLGTMPILRPFVPFVRTPLNILKQGFVESTGLGSVINAAKLASESGFNPTATKIAIAQKLLEDPGETFRIGGQMALMGTVVGSFYMGAMSGAIVGGGPGRWASGGRNSDAQKAWEGMMRDQGKVPYSINVGGTSIPFDRFPEPVATFMRMAADMGMHSAYVGQQSQEEWLAGLTVIGVSGLYNSTFLKGINDIIDLVGDPTAVTYGMKGSKALQNWMSTQMPFGGLLSYVDKQTDPFKHAYGGATLLEVFKVHEDTFGTGIFAKIADRIPGFGGTPTLIDQISGLPVPAMPGHGPGGLNPLQAAIPFMPRGYKGADGAWTAVWNIMGSYKEKTPAQFKLTNAEQQDLNKRMGTMVLGGRTLQQAVLSYADRPEVQQYIAKKGAAVPSVRTAIESGLDGVIRDYYVAALRQMTDSNMSVRQRAILAEGVGDAASQNDLGLAQQRQSRIDELLNEAKLRGVF